jgi:hypothetical protein
MFITHKKWSQRAFKIKICHLNVLGMQASTGNNYKYCNTMK